MRSRSLRHSIEILEPRLLLSATPITFDPEGTLVKGAGTVNGVKFIQLKGGNPGGSINGIPTGGATAGGTARVFATDLNGNQVIDADEITGIALSDNAKATIFGSVNGDIVTNLRGGGDLSGEEKDGSELLTHSVKSLVVKGSVMGNLLTGRGIGTLEIEGSINEVRVGSAASGQPFRFHGPDGEVGAIVPVIMGTNINGGNILKVEIGTGLAGMYAGDGGPGGAGGFISGVKIVNDTDGLVIQAGNGGDRDDRSGGQGGYLSKIEVVSSSGVTVIAGNGGNSIKNNSRGGDGGGIDGARISSLGPVTMTAGHGGDNTSTDSEGGIGGSIEKSAVNGSDCTYTAGHGGDGHKLGGEGGSILGLKSNLAGEANFFAGNGGDAASEAGIGGSISGLKLAAGTEDAFIRAIVAGDGGSAALSGDGGSVSKVQFDGDIGDFMSAYGVGGMGGLFAGLAGAGSLGVNGDVVSIQADRVAAIVAGTQMVPGLASNIKSINASEIGANFDTDSDNDGIDEPAFDYFELLPLEFLYDVGEQPIDGPVLGIKVTGLGSNPLFLYEGITGNQHGDMDPHGI